MAGISRLRTDATPLTRRLLGVMSSRSFGSAAALELHYDEEDEGAQLSRAWSAATEESEGSVSGRGVQWVIMGEPAAKKRVYAERLSKLLDVPRISMGTLLRQELHPTSSLYQQIANAVDHGELVPENIIFGLLSKRLEEGFYRGETGFILDGIPRTKIQAEILDRVADIDLVVNFKCTEENLFKNPLGRGACASCGELHGMGNSMSNLNLQSQYNLPKCSNAEQSKLLEDHYRKQKKLLNFEVAGAPGETWQGLVAALHLQHINALNSSSHKLSA